jgi:hypothetical protein
MDQALQTKPIIERRLNGIKLTKAELFFVAKDVEKRR